MKTCEEGPAKRARMSASEYKELVHGGRPLTPADWRRTPWAELPDFVVNAFNEALVAGAEEGVAFVVVQRKDVEGEIKRRCAGERVPFLERFLDVRDVFEAVGWRVREGVTAYTFFDKNEAPVV